jgi:transposase
MHSARLYASIVRVNASINLSNSAASPHAAYKRRNLIERCVNRLKQFRRIATRYEKTARAYLSMLCIASTLWMKTVNTT